MTREQPASTRNLRGKRPSHDSGAAADSTPDDALQVVGWKADGHGGGRSAGRLHSDASALALASSSSDNHADVAAAVELCGAWALLGQCGASPGSCAYRHVRAHTPLASYSSQMQKQGTIVCQASAGRCGGIHRRPVGHHAGLPSYLPRQVLPASLVCRSDCDLRIPPAQGFASALERALVQKTRPRKNRLASRAEQAVATLQVRTIHRCSYGCVYN